MVWCLGFAFLGSYGPLIGPLIGLVDLHGIYNRYILGPSQKDYIILGSTFGGPLYWQTTI